MATYYEEHKKERINYQKQYRRKNASKIKKSNHNWFIKNREKQAKYRRKYRQTPTGKAATLKAIKNYEAKNPKRKRNWIIARKLKREPCKVCGAKNTHKHHPNIDDPLKVEPLCPLHHKQFEML